MELANQQAPKSEQEQFQEYIPGQSQPSNEAQPFSLPDSLNQAWEETEEASFTPVDPGDYEVVIEDIAPSVSNSGNMMLTWNFSILSQGPMEGRKLIKCHVLTTKEIISLVPGEAIDPATLSKEGQELLQQGKKEIIVPAIKSLPFIKRDFSNLGVVLEGNFNTAIIKAIPELKGVILAVKVTHPKKKNPDDRIFPNIIFKEDCRVGEFIKEPTLDNKGNPILF